MFFSSAMQQSTDGNEAKTIPAESKLYLTNNLSELLYMVHCNWCQKQCNATQICTDIAHTVQAHGIRYEKSSAPTSNIK